MIFIATTTINKTTETLKRFDKSNKCKLIIALDKKSKKLINLENSIILSTEYQKKKMAKTLKTHRLELYTTKKFCNLRSN